MDMYQKREQRKEKKSGDNSNVENTNKVNINWYISTYAKTLTNLYKISLFEN